MSVFIMLPELLVQFYRHFSELHLSLWLRCYIYLFGYAVMRSGGMFLVCARTGPFFDRATKSARTASNDPKIVAIAEQQQI